MPSKSDILKSYRELVYLIKRLPEQQRIAALSEAREKVRSSRHVSKESEASDLHKLMVSKIGYLRMTQPRHPGDRYAKAGVFIVREGKIVEGSAARESRVGKEPISMEEGMTRHHQLLKRQHFGRDPPPIRAPF